MNTKQLCALVSLSLALFACNKDKAAAGETSEAKAEGEKPAAAAAEVSCDAVVKKLASFNPGSGEPENKLWNKMCAAMPPAVRACIVASATVEDSKTCMTGEKLR